MSTRESNIRVAVYVRKFSEKESKRQIVSTFSNSSYVR